MLYNVADCGKQSFCKRDGCRRKHHGLLHGGPRPAAAQQSEKAAVPEEGATCTATNAGARCYLGIVPVTVEVGGKRTKTYAMLDDGSEKSMCCDSLLDRLGVTGKSVQYTVASVNDRQVTYDGRQVDLAVRAVDGGRSVEVRKAWSLPRLPASLKSLPGKGELRSWKHLNDVKLPLLQDGKVELLIGTDAPAAHVPLECRSGRPHEPYAVRTALGWAVRGPRQPSRTARSAGRRGTKNA